jgi:Mg2+/Co2+ transporter CorB
MVTHEVLIEAVVGDLSDEDAEPEPMVIQRSDGSIDVDARIGVRRMGKILRISLDRAKSVTMGGLITSELQRFPKVNDRISYEGLCIEVLSVRRQRAHRLKVLPSVRERVPSGQEEVRKQ